MRRSLPLAVAPALCVFLLAVPGAQTRRASRAGDGVERLREWLAAVDRHEPGARDASVVQVASWSRSELEALYPDVRALLELIAGSGKLPSRRAGGAFAPSVVDQLQQIARERRQQGVNRLAKRGALLHTDTALLVPTVDVPDPDRPAAGSDEPLAPRNPAVRVADGRQEGLHYGAVHWDFARTLLDAVAPAPSRDEAVRLWYRATAVLFTSSRQFADAVPHLDRARRLFPLDPGILLESGYLHEVFAAPHIQDVVRRTPAPGGLVFAVGSERSNLREAEDFFRRAVELDGAFAEARMRLGHVLGLLGRHEDAASQLQRVVSGPGAPILRYDASMFLGNEERALGHRDKARESFERAAALYPRAQSPYLALSQLARESGDRPAALRALQHVLTIPADQSARDDPWWSYYEGQGRDAEPLFAAMRGLLLAEEPR